MLKIINQCMSQCYPLSVSSLSLLLWRPVGGPSRGYPGCGSGSQTLSRRAGGCGWTGVSSPQIYSKLKLPGGFAVSCRTAGGSLTAAGRIVFIVLP